MMQNNETKPVIKIFVSHRTDQVSETIDNPLYVNVRCGAVYDKRNPEEYEHMLGDDTGDNISEKKYKYSELTVQYWAWKNQDADYYGLCHYRRYLSLIEKGFSTDNLGQISCEILNKYNEQKLGLLDVDHMESEIIKYDLIINQSTDIREMVPAFKRKHQSSIMKYWQVREKIGYYHRDSLKLLMSLIKKYYEEYYDSFVKYLNGNKYRGYNCFIMKREIFQKFSEFEFDILQKVESSLNFSFDSEFMQRTCGYLGEILYGGFITYLNDKKVYHIKEVPLIRFDYTAKSVDLRPAYDKNNIPVILMSSEYYIPYVGTFIESMKEHASPNYNYDVIILHKSINSILQSQLKRVVEGCNNISVRFFSVNKVVDDSQFYVSSQYYAVEAYYRILTPWILKYYDKAIVMDSDLVLNGDLLELYLQEIDDKCFAAVKDIVYMGFLNGALSGALEYTKKEMGMMHPYDYVNTGVMLMNLKRIRERYTITDLIEFFQKNHFHIQEQDGLNAFFEGEIKFLDLKWNYYVEVNPGIHHTINFWAPKQDKDVYNAMDPYGDNKPYIIHYASQPKPWSDPNVKYSEFWWSYAAKTEFYPLINFRMAQGSVNGALVFGRLSLARRVADKLLPKGSKRREALKKIMPRGSKQFELLKRMYHKFTF